MPDYTDRMKDYVPVNERIDAFVTVFPEGCLQSEIVELTESRVTVKAYAYRTPTDPRPGTGHSSLNIPGSTPYTKGSEIENAETSAWGRAIAALGFEVKRGISSREDIANKQPGQEPVSAEGTQDAQRGAASPAPASIAKIVARIREVGKEHGLSALAIGAVLKSEYGGRELEMLTREELTVLGVAIAAGNYDVPAELKALAPA